MKQKSKVIMDLLHEIGLKPEEIREVVLELIKEAKFSPKDCFPEKIKQLELTHSEIVAACSKLAVITPSLLSEEENGTSGEIEKKKRGRQKGSKNKKTLAREGKAAAVSENLDGMSGGNDNRSADKNADKQVVTSVFKVTNSEVSLILTEDEQKEVESLKMGKEYPLDILFIWKGKLVRSNRIMSDADPIGVFIPHNNPNLKYKEFVLYYKDEIDSITLKDAESYARNKLPKYKESKWQIMDRFHHTSVKAVGFDLKEIIKKINGDMYAGKYTFSGERVRKTGMKLRYVVNVLPDISE